MVDINDDFELDFQGFKDNDESNIDEEDEVLSFDLEALNVFFSPFFLQNFLLFFFSFNSEIYKNKKK